MIKNLLLVLFFLQFFIGCASTAVQQNAEYPRMPDAYRDNDNNKASRNPMGMAIYDAAEAEAEEDYFGAEVVSLEESQRILKERKLQKQHEQEQKE
jgi:hypothetical protein